MTAVLPVNRSVVASDYKRCLLYKKKYKMGLENGPWGTLALIEQSPNIGLL